MLRILAWAVAAVAFSVVSAARADYLVNGNFESGNTGFLTNYTYSQADIGPAQTYAIVHSPADARPNDINPISYGDHTTGTGLMMAVNGAEIANQLVWSETVTIPANQTYTFSGWISSWFPAAPEGLNLIINGQSIGTVNAPSTTAVWQNFTATWDAGSATTATIELRNITTADIGNDFALDDLSFNGPVVNPVPEPSTMVLALIGCGGLLGWRFGSRRQRVPRIGS